MEKDKEVIKMTSDEEIIKEAQKILDKIKVKGKYARNPQASVMRDCTIGKYVVSLMVPYVDAGGGGIGSMGSYSALDITYKTKKGAEKMKDMINALKPKKKQVRKRKRTKK